MAMVVEAPSAIGPAESMGRPLGWLRRFAILCLLFAMMGLIPLCSVRADEKESSKNQAKRAFVDQQFPWYNAQKGDLVPLFPTKIPPPPPSRSEELNKSFEWVAIIRVVLWVLFALVIIGAIFALIWFGQRFFDEAPLLEKTEATPEIESARLEALPEKVRGKGDLLERARDLAKAGAYAEAIAFLHGWQLIQLDKHGKIELQKGKTNRQYQGELSAALPGSASPGSASAELRTTFRDSTRLFEDAFYGHLPISEPEFQSVWSKIALFEKALPREKPMRGEAPKRGEKPAKGEAPPRTAKAAKAVPGKKRALPKEPPS